MDSSSSNYRRLNRGGSGFTRNVMFFGILVGLVIVFSVFYLYTSASNDASALRFELNSQNDYVTKLKNEVLELHVKLEELKTSEATCKESKLTVDQQSEDCSTNLKQANENIQAANGEKTKLNTELEALKSKNIELSSTLDAQKINMSAMQTVGVGQEAVFLKLNETIDTLRRDLILKDELIKKMETALNKDTPIVDPVKKVDVANQAVSNEKEAIPAPNAPRPNSTITTKSVLPPVVEENIPDVLAVPAKAQPGDRVKMEEANQKKENDGALLKAAQNEDIGNIDAPAVPLANVKSGEI